MARSEQRFIDLCKKQVAQKFSFGNGNGYTQRDLEILSTYIEEQTGVDHQSLHIKETLERQL